MPDIREATRDDAPLILRLIQQSFQTVYDRLGLTPGNFKHHASLFGPEWVMEQMDSGSRFFILEDAGEPVGCVALKPEEGGAVQMRRLGVLPSHRSRGCGRMLVDHSLAEARASGAQRVTLGMWATDLPLRRWYESLGFAVSGTEIRADMPLAITHMEISLI